MSRKRELKGLKMHVMPKDKDGCTMPSGTRYQRLDTGQYVNVDKKRERRKPKIG
jgi:hypothetical protein